MIDMVDEMMKGGTGDKVGLSLVTVEKYHNHNVLGMVCCENQQLRLWSVALYYQENNSPWILMQTVLSKGCSS